MKAPDFNYCCPRSIDEVCHLLDEYGSDARVLAGGQSLVPAMNLRLSSAEVLVDINRVEGLDGVGLSEDQTYVRVGALGRHAQVAASAVIRDHVPLVHQAMKYVAHPAVRNRGTTCGSLALADPSAEMPACAVALNATLVLHSRRDGERQVLARAFFQGLYDTALRDDELLVEVRWPVVKPGIFVGFGEISRRHGDFAQVGVAAQCEIKNSVVHEIDLVTFGVGATPVYAIDAGPIVHGKVASVELAKELAAKVAASLEIDTFDQPDIKRQQARALIARVATQMFQEAGCGNE